MIRRLKDYYNPWFVIPFLLWLLTAAVLLLLFDREVLFATVNTHHTPLLDRFMQRATGLGEAPYITAVLCALLLFRACRNWWYILGALVCNIVPALLVQWIKRIFHAPRPQLVYETADWLHFDQHWEVLKMDSFPSGHTTGAFSMCCFLALILPRKWAWIGLPLFFMALLVAYTRLYLAAHFFADVFAGSIIGVSVALLCYSLLRRYSRWPLIAGAHSEPEKKAA